MAPTAASTSTTAGGGAVASRKGGTTASTTSAKSRMKSSEVVQVAKQLHEMSDEEYEQRIGAYKPGTIRRISLKNFLTHKNVDVRPGPRLNVVCGANGTGKSTLLNAICLGLGGEPKVLGRADDVRDFIMHEEDVAIVEIELEPHPGQPTHVIRRVMDRRKGKDKNKGRGSSTFYVNGTEQSIKKVQELVKTTYSIAVDNLCSLLPQDKVGSFSAMSPQELLLETEKVLDAHQHFYNTHNELLQEEETRTKSASEVATALEELRKLRHQNEQLERAKELLEERERAIQHLDLLKKKQLWMQFEALRELALELKETKNHAKERLADAQKELEPLQVQVNAAANKVKTFEAKERAIKEKVQGAQRESEKHAKKFTVHDDQIESGMLELQAMDDRRAQAEELVRECQARVDSVQEDLDRLPSQEKYEADKEAAIAATREAHKEFGQAKQVVRELQTQLRDVEDRAKAAQSKVARLSDASARRRTAVFRRFPELDKVCQWIEGNRDKFRRPVVGPVAAEITPSTREAAAFVEQHVPNATLKAFCVETMEDRDFLYNEIRKKRGIPINILLLRKEPRRPRVYSAAKMRELSKYGIHGYLDELFTAPDAIMHALIESAHIDRVLVGDAAAYHNLSHVKRIVSEPEDGGTNLKSYVICCQSADGPVGNNSAVQLLKFQGTKSRYANQISVRQDHVEPSRCLSPGIDPAELEAAQAELANAHKEVAELRPQMDDAENRMRETEAELQECQAAQKVAIDRSKSRAKYETKLENSKRKLNEAMAKAAADDKDAKKELAQSIMNRVRSAITALDARSQQIAVMVHATADGLGVNANKASWSTELKMAELAFTEKKQLFDDLYDEVKRANDEFKRAKAEMVAKNEVAKREAPIEDETGAATPLRKVLDEIGITSLDELEVAIEECERAANEVVDNPDAIRQYEQRKRQIEELEAKTERMAQEESDKATKLLAKSKRWERDLENRIAEMNSLFSKYMAEMGFAGELQLYRGEPTNAGSTGTGGDNDQVPQFRNFKDWGVKILVSFRGESKARVLSAQSHSGGERAVSTIMYLMGAQHMLVSPFRCVDEINQGLDERNERLVFSRIVANACSRPAVDDPTDHSGQYFLITPKILPNLAGMDTPGVHVLVVQNGPFNFFNHTHLAALLPLYEKNQKGRGKRPLALEAEAEGAGDQGADEAEPNEDDHDDDDDDDDAAAAAATASEEWCENSNNSSSKGGGGGASSRIPKKKKQKRIRSSTVDVDEGDNDEVVVADDE